MITSLLKVHKELARITGVALQFPPRSKADDQYFVLEKIINKWIYSLPSSQPLINQATWKLLFEVLKELGFKELGKHIEEYLSGE